MYKLVALSALLAVAAAAPAPGLIGAPIASPWGAPLASPWGAPIASPWGAPLAAPLASPWGHGLVGHGLVGGGVYGAPIVKTAVPVATSYANTVRVASPALVAAHSPLVASPYGAYGHGW